MIYVTHDQTEALTFADTVVVMYEGEVVQIGTPEELFERPAPYLRRLFHRLAGHERPAGRVEGRGAARRRRRSSSPRATPSCRRRARIELGIRPEFVAARPRRHAG